jgi:hypothetical protein
VVQIRTEEEAPASDREVHVDFAERDTQLGIIQRDDLMPFLDHVVNEAARRSAVNEGALVVQVDGGGNGGNLLHSADMVGVRRARAVREFLRAGLRARLDEREIHTSMVRFAEPTSRGSALPGGAPATGNQATDASATRRVTVRLEEVPATHQDADFSRPAVLEGPPPSSSSGHREFGEVIAPPSHSAPSAHVPSFPPPPPIWFLDDELVGDEVHVHAPRGRSSLGHNPVDGGSLLAVRRSPDPDESYLDFELDSNPE